MHILFHINGNVIKGKVTSMYEDGNDMKGSEKY